MVRDSVDSFTLLVHEIDGLRVGVRRGTQSVSRESSRLRS
jgi:hypothetical protein